MKDMQTALAFAGMLLKQTDLDTIEIKRDLSDKNVPFWLQLRLYLEGKNMIAVSKLVLEHGLVLSIYGDGVQIA